MTRCGRILYKYIMSIPGNFSGCDNCIERHSMKYKNHGFRFLSFVLLVINKCQNLKPVNHVFQNSLALHNLRFLTIKLLLSFRAAG